MNSEFFTQSRAVSTAAVIPPADARDATRRAANTRCLREGVTVFLVLALLTATLAAIGTDLDVARYCHAARGWRDQGWAFGRMLYDQGKTWLQPAFALAAGGTVFALASSCVGAWRRHAKAALFIPLLLALGPGLIVNGILKDHWGRPRPCQLREFGGVFTFQQPWEPGSPYERLSGEKKPSFPSGHASMGFFVMAPWFVLRRKNFRHAFAWLVTGILFGGLVGAARVSQGGHFPTDILWSGGVVYLSGLLLARLTGADGADVEEKLRPVQAGVTPVGKAARFVP